MHGQSRLHSSQGINGKGGRGEALSDCWDRGPLAVDRKQRTAAKYAICFRDTGLAPGLSLPPPSRALVGVSPQVQIYQGHKNTCCPGDLVLGLVEAWPRRLVPRNAAGQALSFGPGY